MSFRDPVFKIFTGPMFGSKTTQMLACIDRYRYQNKTCVAFKPAMDDRYDVDKIQTHSGLSIEANCVKTGQEILEIVDKMEKDQNKPVDVVAVDEAFMIKGSAEALINLYRSGINVCVASIQMSFLGNPFDEITTFFIPASFFKILIISKKSFLTVGSPPVSLILQTPNLEKTLAKRLISSK